MVDHKKRMGIEDRDESSDISQDITQTCSGFCEQTCFFFLLLVCYLPHFVGF